MHIQEVKDKILQHMLNTFGVENAFQIKKR